MEQKLINQYVFIVLTISVTLPPLLVWCQDWLPWTPSVPVGSASSPCLITCGPPSSPWSWGSSWSPSSTQEVLLRRRTPRTAASPSWVLLTPCWILSGETTGILRCDITPGSQKSIFMKKWSLILQELFLLSWQWFRKQWSAVQRSHVSQECLHLRFQFLYDVIICLYPVSQSPSFRSFACSTFSVC